MLKKKKSPIHPGIKIPGWIGPFIIKIRRKMIYCGLGILSIEIIGIILISNIMLHHYIFLGEVLAMVLVVILLVLSTLIARKYYSFVAYICPNCNKKSYCLEVGR